MTCIFNAIYCCYLMYLRTCTSISMSSSLEKYQSEIRSIYGYPYVISVRKRYQKRNIHAIHQLYVKANNKYVEYYNKNKEWSDLKYWDVSNIYGWAMSQKLPSGNFNWVKETSEINEDFKKGGNDERTFFLHVRYPENIYDLNNDLPFLPERSWEKLGKLVKNLHDKEEFVMHIINLKQPLNHGSILKKGNGVVLKVKLKLIKNPD